MSKKRGHFIADPTQRKMEEKNSRPVLKRLRGEGYHEPIQSVVEDTNSVGDESSTSIISAAKTVPVGNLLQKKLTVALHQILANSLSQMPSVLVELISTYHVELENVFDFVTRVVQTVRGGETLLMVYSFNACTNEWRRTCIKTNETRRLATCRLEDNTLLVAHVHSNGSVWHVNQSTDTWIRIARPACGEHISYFVSWKDTIYLQGEHFVHSLALPIPFSPAPARHAVGMAIDTGMRCKGAIIRNAGSHLDERVDVGEQCRISLHDVEWKRSRLSASLSALADKAAYVALEDGIYIFGGDNKISSSRGWQWTPEDDLPEPASRIGSPHARSHHVAVAISPTKCWLMGGRYVDSGIVTDLVEEYDCESRTFTTLPWTLDKPRASLTARYDMSTGALYVAGPMRSVIVNDDGSDDDGLDDDGFDDDGEGRQDRSFSVKLPNSDHWLELEAIPYYYRACPPT